MKNYEKCRYVKTIGQIAVYVEPNCVHSHLLKGQLVISKQTCEKCKNCKKRE